MPRSFFKLALAVTAVLVVFLFTWILGGLGIVLGAVQGRFDPALDSPFCGALVLRFYRPLKGDHAAAEVSTFRDSRVAGPRGIRVPDESPLYRAFSFISGLLFLSH